MLLLFAFLTTSIAQDIEITCVFQWSFFNEYTCYLENITVLDPSVNVVFIGEHLANLTDHDVEVVEIRNSNTAFMIPEMFTTFPNIFELIIEDSNLQSFDIPSSVQLLWLRINRNNISHIGSGSIRGQSRLYFMELNSNGIVTIAEDAFVDLIELNSLLLINNEIEEIQEATFHQLTFLTSVDIQRNNLKRIGENTFSRNTNLFSLYLDSNQIDAIHPHFASNLANLRYFNLNGNSCIDRNFQLQGEQTLIEMNLALQTCYHSYNGGVPEIRRITMQFRGSLTILDEFGNIVARI